MSVASFTADDVQSPSPFLSSVAVEAGTAAVCFLLFLAAAPAVAPSSFFLLGAMETVAALKVEMSLVGETMAKEREEEDDGVCRGEWVKVKSLAPLSYLQYEQTNHSRSKRNVLLHTIWPSTWRTWRLIVVAHYARKKRDMITSLENRPFRSETVHASL